MEFVSQSKNLRLAPKKLRKVADVVRGLNVNKALISLQFMDEKGAYFIFKTLSSALANANASDNFDKDLNSLVVKAITVDEGPALKRFRPRAQGRATRIRKRTSHLKVIIG
jgi:large subunit ribosomal protein L22